MSDYFTPMQRTTPERKPRDPIVAYDFETTNIPTGRRFGKLPADLSAYIEAEWAREIEEYERVSSSLKMQPVHPGFLMRNGRLRLRGEWEDVPRRYLDLRNPREGYGDVDDRAAELGFMDGDELREWMITAKRPVRPKQPREEERLLTIQPRYITMHAQHWALSRPLAAYEDILEVVREIWPKLHNRTQLVAYNANRFDLRIIMQALIGSEFTLEPFASRVAGLRGAIVRKGRKRVFFLDPIAMLGMQCNLATFLAVFAPQYPKGKLDFERCSFDARNPAHVAYAERDAEALYHAMQKAQTVVRTITGHNLAPTIGALAIRTFMSRMPRGVIVPALRPEQYHVVRKIVMRGGYVVSRRFKGKLWTYDINQAYAFAMRDCNLPAGRAFPLRSMVCDPTRPGCYLVKLSRQPRSPVPYVVRALEKPHRLFETFGEPVETWLTNDEVVCLQRHGWEVSILDGFVFAGSFSMRTFVNGLEARRRNFKKDHPVNVICKYIGCNAYGKTLQEPITSRIVLAHRQPRNGFPMREQDEEGAVIPGWWIVPEDKDTRRQYERPQIGAWITAYVRCTVFDAIMRDPEHFVKADTDSVSFSRPCALPISTWQYGKWKIEANGTFHIVVAKKVYWSADKKAAKGMRLKRLGKRSYEKWYLGDVPVQHQIQLQTWKRGAPAPRWKRQRRRGTKVDT